MTARAASPVVGDVALCPPTARCLCFARGVVTVRGYGRATVAFYRNRLRDWVTGGFSDGGKAGQLTPNDFATEAMQAAIVPAFAAVMNVESAPPPEPAT